MKIVYLTNSRIPTEQTHGYQICKTCEALARNGCDVELRYPRRNNNISTDVFGYYGLEKIFKVSVIKLLLFPRIAGPLYSYSAKLNSFLLFISWYFKRPENWSLVFTRDPELAWLFSSRGYKTALEVHDWPQNIKRRVRRMVERTDLIVAISHGLKKALVEDGYDAEKIVVVPDGVDLKLFDLPISARQARQSLGLREDRKIVMYTGHLYGWKGAQVLADAVKFLDKNLIVYFIGGRGSDQAEFAQVNQEMIKSGRIMLFQHQPRKIMPYWLKAADVLVLPNSGKQKISSEYTSPLKLFEYMASKRPIVASDLPSIREILNDNCAYFFKADNPLSLSNSIKIALNDPGIILQNAYNASRGYDWKNRAEKIITSFKKTADSNIKKKSFSKFSFFAGIHRYAVIAGLGVLLIYGINYIGVECFSIDPRITYLFASVLNYGLSFVGNTKVFGKSMNSSNLKRFIIAVIAFFILINGPFNLMISIFEINYILAITLNFFFFPLIKFSIFKYWVFSS